MIDTSSSWTTSIQAIQIKYYRIIVISFQFLVSPLRPARLNAWLHLSVSTHYSCFLVAISSLLHSFSIHEVFVDIDQDRSLQLTNQGVRPCLLEEEQQVPGKW